MNTQMISQFDRDSLTVDNRAGVDIKIAQVDISQDLEGRYSLNDLHGASGGAARHNPGNWLRLEGTNALIREISNSSDMKIKPVVSLAGRYGGSYVCRELVYAYAMWISAKFHLQVIRAYDSNSTANQFAVPQSLPEALRLAANQAETIERQQASIDAAAPKVEFVDRYASARGSKGFREVCKLLGANEAQFRLFLLDKKIAYRLDGVLTPFQSHIDADRFEVKTGISTVSEHAFNQMRFTPKGVTWIAGEWGKHNIAAKEETMQ